VKQIHIRDVLDYCHCPMLYRYKHADESDRLQSKRISVIEKYDHDLHKAVFAFLAALQNQEDVPAKSITNIWGSIWLGNKTQQEIIYTSSYSWGVIENDRRKRGLESLMAVFEHYRKNPGVIIAVNEPYKIQISKDLELIGEWDLIREVKSGIEVVDFKTDDKVHNKVVIEHDLELTAAAMAFRHVFKLQEDRLSYFGLDRKKIQSTKRGLDDFKRLKHTVRCVATSIDQNLFYAKPDVKCRTCPYRIACASNMGYDMIRPGGTSHANATN